MAAFLLLVRRLYFALYNWILFIGWFQVLYLVLKALKESGHEHVYSVAEKPMLFSQTAAVLEIFHGLAGLVRSPVAATLPQIASRLYLMWGILWSFPETRTHVLVSSLLISFSITEAVRYAFYGMKETFGFVPSWLLWLRYNTFFVMFLTGIISEVGLIYSALPFIKETGKYSTRMPNKWNLSFDYSYVAIGVLGIYVPGVPHLFRHMLAQRKKALSKSKRE
ncbi:very-long-chain (3R)-3-hydroxyacyl-CoA dehydratase PASTICCINO 2B-like [Prosopis cineraria]|uniref:very-long-chain (3R)-3-hydroxyacyl-CoA dehydratase PASTICCINO 2B-like n=1 Tax=Prosopis cineraria TaxID=364024 RepID=UPI00240FF48A|nr:very-long-chain (3R)-3-hydroxyacyl-CoA dehydratase PASTICCINO 2B-like [Prosopis cineraria]